MSITGRGSGFYGEAITDFEINGNLFENMEDGIEIVPLKLQCS